jgi:hypothetical protein
MKMFAQWLSGAIVSIAVILFCAAQPALADGYTVVNLGDSNGHGIYGIDTAGDVVVWGTSGCGASAAYCYVTYVDGVATGDSSVAPVLAFNNGAACSSPIAGFNTSKTICNIGWTGLGSLYNPNGDSNGIYFGLGSDLNFIQSGSADQVFLNSSGDFAWTNGQTDEMYELIENNSVPQFDALEASSKDFAPASTPEPGALLLVGTGLVGITALLRRRFTRYRDLSE